MPTFKIPIDHLPHPHLPWIASTDPGDRELGHALRTFGPAIGWGVLIVFGVSMMVALGFALVHVMNFWSLPGVP